MYSLRCCETCDGQNFFCGWSGDDFQGWQIGKDEQMKNIVSYKWAKFLQKKEAAVISEKDKEEL